MKTKEQTFRIALVEDNEFEINLLERNIQDFIQSQKLFLKQPFFIEKFSSFQEFYNNFKDDTAIVFSDFHLGNRKTGIDVLQHVKQKNLNCKVIMMSSSDNEWKLYLSLLEGATGIIFKNESKFKLCNFLIYKHFIA